MVDVQTKPIPATKTRPERSLDTNQLIDRIANDLKASSDADLPHCYFVEQARLRLAGQQGRLSAANDATHPLRKQGLKSSASVFYAWAMPE
ncbi:hypothetical protein NAC44_02510 [Allorhizobium sp. BGMRC 0089]|uniref:hypothetical protein n=1 Tax=Allorhizobium sonneratiae TaxID=2934936 RepID=UPI002033397B|nr:hypothetical protein [Allorhizobium sonneratiae]MCM2291201.1 hypothetical protein [Allorhizobium sonneratiae]